ncbi:MAG: hypothetical protein ACXWV1_15390 [Chitinophagaceae bacterium]
MLRQLLYIICIIFILYLQLPGLSGCAKEYSYEGRPTNNTLPITDSLPIQDTTDMPQRFSFLCGMQQQG